MNWQPWLDYRDEESKTLPISAPPCPYCSSWNPQVSFFQSREGYLFDSVVCCHAKEQFKDFSCFKAKKGGDNS